MAYLVLFVFGTRPEAIKMAPLIRRMAGNPAVEIKVCVTGQHREMLEQALRSFGLGIDENLSTMRQGQSLNGLSWHLLDALDWAYQQYQPDMVVVHGDTTSCAMAALAAFHLQIPIAHVEAGLRTGDLASPWPEEANRRLTAVLANLHFAPTLGARENLLRENIPAKNIYVTGNTVIDALLWMRGRLAASGWKPGAETGLGALPDDARVILVTCHRRENLNGGLETICAALARLSKRYPDDHFIYPVHLNPAIQSVVQQRLEGLENIHLTSPLNYEALVWCMARCHLILTDSGGIQEEAPSLGKPVLIMRDHTERPEGVEAGALKLVGLDEESIYCNACCLLDDPQAYRSMSEAVNPFGDGMAAERIESHILEWMVCQEKRKDTTYEL